jgi:hypothetical protein
MVYFELPCHQPSWYLMSYHVSMVVVDNFITHLTKSILG